MFVHLSIQVDDREPVVIEEELSGSAEEREERVREVLQRSGRVMLEPAFQEIADQTSAPYCCGKSMKNCGLRTVVVITTCGEVILQRRRYRCRRPECKHEIHPADARLCCGKHRLSKALAKRVCQLATVEHFTRLPELLMAQHGVTLCHETILELAHDVGGTAERLRLAGAQSSAARRVPPAVIIDKPAKRIYISVDGIMYCTNESEPDPDHPDQKRLIWQQMKVGCVYWQDAQDGWHKQMTWGREPPDEFGASLWRLAMQCGYGQAEERIFAADGGAWCWDIHARYFSDAAGVLDWFHAVEHIWETAKVTDPDSSLGWANEAITRMHDGGGTALSEWLKQQLASRRGHSRQALQELYNYVIGKVHFMDYPTAKQRGWQIGSGMIESTCKQLVAQRLKGPGMHWTEAGAIAITALRATDLNGRWNNFWSTITIKT